MHCTRIHRPLIILPCDNYFLSLYFLFLLWKPIHDHYTLVSLPGRTLRKTAHDKHDAVSSWKVSSTVRANNLRCAG